jgi:hypothetical protein
MKRIHVMHSLAAVALMALAGGAYAVPIAQVSEPSPLFLLVPSLIGLLLARRKPKAN